MNRRRRWIRLGLVAATALAGVLVVGFAPHATGAAGPSPSPIPQGCQLQSPQPDAPLKLNLVAAGGFVKSIVVEKEIFNCYDAKSSLASIKDVETVIETVERGLVSRDARGNDRSTMTAVAKSVEVDTCTKNLQTGGISCTSQAMPLGVTSTPLAKCSVTKGTYPFDVVQQPAHPLEMSTVALENGLVETVHVEKEIFDCSGQIGDLYLFHRNIEVQDKTGFEPVAYPVRGRHLPEERDRRQLTQCKVFTPSRPG